MQAEFGAVDAAYPLGMLGEIPQYGRDQILVAQAGPFPEMLFRPREQIDDVLPGSCRWAEFGNHSYRPALRPLASTSWPRLPTNSSKASLGMTKNCPYEKLSFIQIAEPDPYRLAQGIELRCIERFPQHDQAQALAQQLAGVLMACTERVMT